MENNTQFIFHIIYNVIILIDSILSYNSEGRPRSLVQAISALIIYAIYSIKKPKPTEVATLEEVVVTAPQPHFQDVKNLIE
jgi:hypothetical protein